MELKAIKTVIDKNGYKVFTEGHSYGVMFDKGNVLALYSDLKAMYNVDKGELPKIFDMSEYNQSETNKFVVET